MRQCKRGDDEIYLRVIEEGVHSPRERLTPLVEEIVCRNFGEYTAILVFDVLDVSSVFGFGVVYPCDANGDWKKKRMNMMMMNGLRRLTTWNTNEVADN
jgi:hypothetical protein